MTLSSKISSSFAFLRWRGWLPLAAGLAFAGCAQVKPGQAGLTAKPNMEFSDSLVFNYQNKLLPQVEPGATLSGGAQSAGASCCK